MGQVERAVHISGSLGASLLETECASRLDTALYPGLRHVLRWMAECRPDRFGTLAACVDELYLLLATLLHYHHLHEADGSFGEHFYGLARVRIDDPNRTPDRLSSLLWLTAVPYVCLKLDQKISAYRLQLVDGVLFNELERAVKLVTCWAGSVLRAAAACWRVAELTTDGGGTLPALRLQGARLSAADGQRNEPSAVLQGFAFGAQLLAAATGDAGSERSPLATLLPPPAYDVRAASHGTRCPVCSRSPPISATAVATSGYVYCFGCIVHHVQATPNAKCPVTSLPISLQHLIRTCQSDST